MPPESIPLPSKRRKLTQHVTGSARSEGYYKIDPMDKKAYLRHSLPSFATPTPRNEASKKEVINILWPDLQLSTMFAHHHYHFNLVLHFTIASIYSKKISSRVQKFMENRLKITELNKKCVLIDAYLFGWILSGLQV